MAADRRSRFPKPALIVVLLLLAAGPVLAVTAGAADPESGTVSLDADKTVTGWNGDRFTGATVPTENACAVPDTPLCDHFTLTVDVPKSHWATHTGGAEINIAWASEEEDFDLAVYDGSGSPVPVESAASGGTSGERVLIQDANEEDGPYRVEVVPFSVEDSDYKGGARIESRAKVPSAPTTPLSSQPCVNGKAGPFPCDDVNLEGFLPIESMGGRPAACANQLDGNCGNLNDIWGWTDPQTGREYALVSRTNGTSFVDVSNPTAPKWLGNLARHGRRPGAETIFNVWGDIKVYKDHAFIVSEEPDSGLQVFDLTKLRTASRTEENDFTEDAHYSYVRDGIASVVEVDPTRLLNPPDNTHNLAINEESGFAYSIGTSTCGGGGPHMVDIRDPKNPKFAGCVSEDGYTHDTQCVNYREGDPDPAFAGREICFNSNEDTLTIVDVTDKDAPKQLARRDYDTANYTHQGWLTKDRRFFLVDDELDEQAIGGKTKTYVFDVRKLANPQLTESHDGKATSIDHNQYVVNDRSFQANYRSGLRVLNVGNLNSGGDLSEAGFFDIFPQDDAAEFNGMWSNYPFFKSGIVIASGIEQGLFVLRPTGEAAAVRPAGATTRSSTRPATAAGCGVTASRVKGKSIGAAGLGRKRAAVRKSLGSAGRNRKYVDRYCLKGGGALRVGYPSQRTVKPASRRDRRRVRGRSVLVLTSGKGSSIRRVKPGASRRTLLRRIGRRSRGIRVGKNVWYVKKGRRSTLLFKVRRGRVAELGLADRRFTSTRSRARSFLNSFR